MTERTKKICLSNFTEYELRGGVCIKVYPASLETLSQLDPKLKKLDEAATGTDLSVQTSVFVDVVHDLIKDDNDINKADLKKALTIEACTKIIQTAMGSLGSFSS